MTHLIRAWSWHQITLDDRWHSNKIFVVATTQCSLESAQVCIATMSTSVWPSTKFVACRLCLPLVWTGFVTSGVGLVWIAAPRHAVFETMKSSFASFRTSSCRNNCGVVWGWPAKTSDMAGGGNDAVGGGRSMFGKGTWFASRNRHHLRLRLQQIRTFGNVQVRFVLTTPSQDLRFANIACPKKVPSAFVTDGFHIVKIAPCAWRAPIDAINNIRLALSSDTFGSRRRQFAQRCWRL